MTILSSLILDAMTPTLARVQLFLGEPEQEIVYHAAKSAAERAAAEMSDADDKVRTDATLRLVDALFGSRLMIRPSWWRTPLGQVCFPVAFPDRPATTMEAANALGVSPQRIRELIDESRLERDRESVPRKLLITRSSLITRWWHMLGAPRTPSVVLADDCDLP